VLLTGALTLVLGSGETSVWVDAWHVWWCSVRAKRRGVGRLMVYLDNWPQNRGQRRQFLKRLMQFADWSGLTFVV